MKSLASTPLAELPGLRYHCSCGKTHAVDIRKIIVGSGVFAQFIQPLKDQGAKQVYVIADSNTYRIAGKQAEAVLKENGLAYHSKILESVHALVPDETALGALIAAMQPGDDYIVAVGSGSINDLSRMVSARTGIPYLIAATAPSMDGYASTVSPLILDGTKITKEAVYPDAIIADTAILKQAPMDMLTAGYGDIIGKLTANADWQLAREINGEYYCEECAAFVNRAVKACTDNAAGLQNRDELAIGNVTEALILSGIAIGLVGNSRPASGAEHHFSHYWEVDAIKNGQPHALHGNSVAVGSVIVASLYELAKPYLPAGFTFPDKQAVLAVLKPAGAYTKPHAIGIGRELFHSSILHAMEIRERYTILRFCAEKGLLAGFADILTGTYYPG